MTLLYSMESFFKFLPGEQRQVFLGGEGLMSSISQKLPFLRLDPVSYESPVAADPASRWLAGAIVWHDGKLESPQQIVSQ